LERECAARDSKLRQLQAEYDAKEQHHIRNGAQLGQPCQNEECKKEKEKLQETLHRYDLAIMTGHNCDFLSMKGCTLAIGTEHSAANHAKMQTARKRRRNFRRLYIGRTYNGINSQICLAVQWQNFMPRLSCCYPREAFMPRCFA